MNQSIMRMNSLLAAAWPKISEIDWTQFGDKLDAYDEEGVMKWTGMLTHFACEQVVAACTQQYGFLPRPEKSAKIVVSKIDILRNHCAARCSMEFRDPQKSWWSGGIRASHSPHQLYALTGLPEIGDHLVLAKSMHSCGLLNVDDCVSLTRSNTACMTAARKHVGMSESQFKGLYQRIDDIFQIVSAQ